MKNTIGMMKRVSKNDIVEMLQFESLGNDCNIFHFITTRNGGVSEGEYTSFNLGAYCGDNPAAVFENRRLLCESLDVLPERLYVPYQTHGAEIKVLDDDFFSLDESRQEICLKGVDGLLTNISGVCIAVTTADCVPLLFNVPDSNVIGVVHAGWRGTVGHIAAKAVEKMTQFYSIDPSGIRVGIGPSISAEVFEVGNEVVDSFRDSGFDMSRICRSNQKTGKSHIDLVEANRLQLINAGVFADHIEISGICTYAMPDDFFSARRQGINSGRFLSGIMLIK